jgi:4-hydroxy-tetrahydrodipicolinate synthase
VHTALEKVRELLNGVVAVAVTPFNEDLSVDEEGFVRVIRHMRQGGVEAITVNGNTGEFFSLTADERRLLVRLALDATARSGVIAGVGLDSRTASQEAQLFADLGVSAIMIHDPAHPFWSREGWAEYNSEICRSVPETPVVLYVRSQKVDADAIAKVARENRNVVGIKYANEDVQLLREAMRRSSRDLVWVCGLAELWFPVFSILGVSGFTTGLANVAPKKSLGLHYQVYARGPSASAGILATLEEFETMRQESHSRDNVSVVKEALAQLGVCGRAVRPPLSTLSVERRDRVSRLLSAWEADDE